MMPVPTSCFTFMDEGKGRKKVVVGFMCPCLKSALGLNHPVRSKSVYFKVCIFFRNSVNISSFKLFV